MINHAEISYNEVLEWSEPFTILIRWHDGRQELIERAIRSVPLYCDIIKMYCPTVNDYSYNLFCNDLKTQVNAGYFMFLDSDDEIIPNSIDKIVRYLNPDKPLIVQMLRNGRPKPRNGLIEKGKIGMPCMILHSKHKHLADVTATEDGDFKWIKAVTDKIGYEFVPIPLVDAGKRNRGK